MLLEHAFKKLGCICVGFWPHFMNHQSEIGIEIKKAWLKGLLRSNAIQKDGPIREKAVYLFINYEWNSVLENLEYQIAKER